MFGNREMGVSAATDAPARLTVPESTASGSSQKKQRKRRNDYIRSVQVADSVSTRNLQRKIRRKGGQPTLLVPTDSPKFPSEEEGILASPCLISSWYC